MSQRRHLLTLPLLLGACSVLPDRPAIEVRRFPLTAPRPGPPRRGRPTKVLLMRPMRGAPSLETRSLRTLRPDGTVDEAFYTGWVAPPAELADEALRRWLVSANLFSAVTAAGSRARPDLILESDLIELRAEPARGMARCGISGVLLAEALEGPRVLKQFVAEAQAPLAAIGPDAAAAGMAAAMGAALALVEAQLAAFA